MAVADPLDRAVVGVEEPHLPVVGQGPRTRRCHVTSQNHGYAVDARTLPDDWEVWFLNANDGSVEGIRHRHRPFSAVQFHPEASCGPVDTGYLFDDFLDQVRAHQEGGSR